MAGRGRLSTRLRWRGSRTPRLVGSCRVPVVWCRSEGELVGEADQCARWLWWFRLRVSGPRGTFHVGNRQSRLTDETPELARDRRAQASLRGGTIHDLAR